MPWIATAVLAAFTSLAHAAPAGRLFRVVHWSPLPDPRPAFVSYLLSSAGDRVSLDIETRTFDGQAHKWDDPRTWTRRTTESYTGTARAVRGATVLHLVSPGNDVTYRCQTIEVPVAPAGAARVSNRRHEEDHTARWRRGTTVAVHALVCTQTALAHHADHALWLESVLVFARRGIEHVIADGSCCQHPGDSLRWVPEDRSVARGIE